MSFEGTAAVEKEIAQEKAESLTLAARLLESALAALREHDAAPTPDPAGAARDRLIAQAAHRAQNLIIQRESLGLRDATYVLKFYSVPREVVARIGVRPG
jgi:hypothetical protein